MQKEELALRRERTIIGIGHDLISRAPSLPDVRELSELLMYQTAMARVAPSSFVFLHSASASF
jgi:hypothetical protein